MVSPAQVPLPGSQQPPPLHDEPAQHTFPLVPQLTQLLPLHTWFMSQLLPLSMHVPPWQPHAVVHCVPWQHGCPLPPQPPSGVVGESIEESPTEVSGTGESADESGTGAGPSRAPSLVPSAGPSRPCTPLSCVTMIVSPTASPTLPSSGPPSRPDRDSAQPVTPTRASHPNVPTPGRTTS